MKHEPNEKRYEQSEEKKVKSNEKKLTPKINLPESCATVHLTLHLQIRTK